MIPALVCATALAGVPAELGEWQVLEDGEVHVACAQGPSHTWCRSTADLPAPMERIERILLDIERYPSVFERITSASSVGPETIHIVLDMPFPLANRDYLARFDRSTDGEALVITWEADDRVEVPEGRAVRLEHAAGEWRLDPAGEGLTGVRYTWNGDLGADFPGWALRKAWRIQGMEVMGWLADAAQ